MAYLTYHVKREDHGKEVLSILREQFGLTTTKIRSVKWDPVGILLDGRRVTVRHRIQEGQILQVLKDDSENKGSHIIPCPMPLDILYEDEDLLILNKPAGTVCHPSRGHSTDSLANGIVAYFESKGENSRVHLLGRLDKDTSGILGIAKNGWATQRMNEARRLGCANKEYLAIVEGKLPEPKGSIQISMEPYQDPEDGYLKMRQVRGPMHCKAKTIYEVIRNTNTFSLCKVRIETGKMHQIRFHMAAVGHPLLGDAIYGHGPVPGMDRSALHAHRLDFIHPVSGKHISLKAEMPEDMHRYLSGKRDLSLMLRMQR